MRVIDSIVDSACACVACALVKANVPVCVPSHADLQVRAVGPWPFPLSHRVHRCIEALIADLDGVTIADVRVACPNDVCPGTIAVKHAKRIAATQRRGALFPCGDCDGGMVLSGFVSSWGSADAAVAPDALAAEADGAIAHASGLAAGPARQEAQAHASRAVSRYVPRVYSVWCRWRCVAAALDP